MKKRDFLAGFCCGAFIAQTSGLDLSSVLQILIVALVVLVLSSLWDWIKEAVNGNTNRAIILKRLHEENNALAMQKKLK